LLKIEGGAAMEEVRQAYDQLLELARNMSAAGHYEVTYHILMAALHCAEDAGDAARLHEVAQLCRQHRKTIDAIQPPHRLSTHSAHARQSIFEAGAIMAVAEIKRLESQHLLSDLRARMGRVNTPTGGG
jgi:hypothetical protein